MIVRNAKPLTEKPKKRPPFPNLLLPAARLALGFAVIFTLAAVLQIRMLFDIYATLSGMMITLFWPLVAFAVLLALIWSESRAYGRQRNARAMTLLLNALAILSLGAMFVARNGF